MRREKKLQWRKRLLAGALVMGMVFALALSADGLRLISRAESQAKVLTNANIRAQASTSSDVVGGATKGGTVSVISQVQGSDGKIWYEIWVDSTKKGFIRSDLVELIDGSTPPAGGSATPAPTVTSSPETPVAVTDVNPVSATVDGGTSVRVRSNASTTSQILATVSNGLALTVIGQANGTDGKVWYKVNFISNDAQVNGFIRSDFVKLSGELTPVTQNPPATEPPVETEAPLPPVESDPPASNQKEYDTVLAKNGWMLYHTSDPNNGWEIDTLINGSGNDKTVKNQKVIIIILVILLVGVIAGASYLVLKFKDMADSAYFNQVESETLRKRSAAQGNNQRLMHTVGTEKSSSRPTGTTGQRPAGAAGQRPTGTTGQRPAGTAGQRPTGAPGQRPTGTAGQRPEGTTGQRPEGAQGQRPETAQGQKPDMSSVQKPVAAQGQKPAGQQQGRPVTGQDQRLSAAGQTDAAKTPQREGTQQGWKSRNFMSEDDDEFEFEFLNVDKNGEGK